jgi:carbamoyltransferase
LGGGIKGSRIAHSWSVRSLGYLFPSCSMALPSLHYPYSMIPTFQTSSNDERLVREKMVFGVPRESVKLILETYGVSPEEIDGIAVGTENQHLFPKYADFRGGCFGLSRGAFKQTLFEVASRVSKYRNQLPILDDGYYLLRQPAFAKRRRELKRIFSDEFGLNCPVTFLDHHFCHAASAYYTSGFKEATVVTVDGGGDGKSCRVYGVADGRFQDLHSISTFDSIGNFYAYVTEVCGFKAGRHEGKVTGLAAYGEPVYIPQLQRILAEKNGEVTNVARVFYLSALKEIERLLPKDFSHKDLAASIQTYTEHMIENIVSRWTKETGHGNVALAGGVFSNVKINQRVDELPNVNSAFVHPSMSDEGIPVGAALAAYFMSGGEYDPNFVAMEHVYLGPCYSNEEIGQELNKHGVAAAYYEHVEPEIAQLLAGGAVVARFNGRMEYGPRALDNRSILYQPTDPSVNYWMNDALQRTEFMPFAPVVMAEYASKCFKGLKGAKDTARFMTITFDCTDWMAETCPGGPH